MWYDHQKLVAPLERKAARLVIFFADLYKRHTRTTEHARTPSMRGSSHHTKSSLRRERDAIRRAELLRGGARLTARRRAYNDGVRRLRLRGGEKRKEPPSVNLFDAIKDGDVRAVREALDRGASPNEQNDRGETALHVAALETKPDVVELLLKSGANPNKSLRGETPLHAVADIPHLFYALGTDPDEVSRTAQLLLKHGADIHAKKPSHGGIGEDYGPQQPLSDADRQVYLDRDGEEINVEPPIEYDSDDDDDTAQEITRKLEPDQIYGIMTDVHEAMIPGNYHSSRPIEDLELAWENWRAVQDYTEKQLTSLRTTRAKIGRPLWQLAEQHYQREFGDDLGVELDDVISTVLRTGVAEFVKNWRLAPDNQIGVLRGRQVRRKIPTELFKSELDMMMEHIRPSRSIFSRDKTALEIARDARNQPVIDVLEEAYKALAARDIRVLSSEREMPGGKKLTSLPGDGLGPASLIAEYMYGEGPAREGSKEFAAAERRKQERYWNEPET